MSSVMFCDFETRSPVDLKKEGLARYAKHPQTEPLMMAWAFGEEPAALWQPGESLPERVRHHIESGGLVVAHNAQFELAIFNFIMVKRFDWPRVQIAQTRCTMAAAYSMSLPGALEDAAHALGLKVEKDAEGRKLMLSMCKPRGWDGDKPLYHETPEQMQRLGAYCMTDVDVERAIYNRVHPLTDKEQRLWELDQVINLRGVPIDMESLRGALVVADSEKERLNDEMARVTERRVTACSAVAALKDWAADYGVMRDSLAKAEINELLGEECLPDVVEEALKLRQSAGRFTSISKLNAIDNRQVNDRVMYGFQYHAATTGRWAGRGAQFHNFTRDLPPPHEVEDILLSIRSGRVRWLDIAYGEPSIMISKCLRGFILASAGNMLLGGDFSNVEGRGICWLSGEDWKLDAYRDYDTIIGHDDNGEPIRKGPDLYKVAYSKTFNIPVEKVTKDNRQIGKVEELAFGYQGGVGAFRTMGKAYGIRVVKEITPAILKKGGLIVTEDQADEFKVGWRQGHPKIVQYWYDLQKAAIAAVRDPGKITSAGAPGREVRFRKAGSFLWCRLPSGRTLCYPYPEIRDGDFGPFLSLKGVPDATVWAIYTGQKERGEPNTTYIVDDPANSKRWCRIATYSGKLAENITQAICRDILAEAMMRAEAAGFPVVCHIHDEIIVEGKFTEQDRIRFEKLMTEVPAWAKDFPISAGCWMSARYIKE